MYIVELTYNAPQEAIEPLREAHMQWVKTHFDLGHFLASGKKETLNGGIILVSSHISAEMLNNIIADDAFTAVADYRITQTNITSTQADLEILKTA